MSNFLDLPQGKKNFLQKNWKDLSGQNNWVGLLSPLDGLLRRYILHYGDLAQSTYDAFDSNLDEGCRFAKTEFFNGVGLNYGHPPFYKVTKYLYATSSEHLSTCFPINSTNWLGYIAVSTDIGTKMLGRRDIVISLRGTVRAIEWLKDIEILLREAPDIFHSSEPKVHSGWHSLYTTSNEHSLICKTSAREQILEEVRRLVEFYKTKKISISVCGHSLGAAVATLVATDIVINGYNVPNGMPHKPCIVTAFLFASPKVGNRAFYDMVSNLGNLHILRVKNDIDLVPRLPLLRYKEVGQVLEVDTRTSDYVLKNDCPIISHILEVHLHLVAELLDSDGRILNRDIALMNKHGHILKDDFRIPSAWWSPPENNGMVREADGWKHRPSLMNIKQ